MFNVTYVLNVTNFARSILEFIEDLY